MYNPENIDTNSLLGDDLVGDLLVKGISTDSDRDNGLLSRNKFGDDSAFSDPLSQELKPLEVSNSDRDLRERDIFQDSDHRQNDRLELSVFGDRVIPSSDRNSETSIEPKVAKNSPVDSITGNSKDRPLVNEDSETTFRRDRIS